jgi:DNA-binding MarR family transcriptional regulator
MADFNYHQLDEIIHSRIRLAVMSVLVSIDQADFTFLKDQVKTTDGNLSIHLRKLEAAGYIASTKQFLNRRPVSSYRMTPKGRIAFANYVEKIEKLIR